MQHRQSQEMGAVLNIQAAPLGITNMPEFMGKFN